MKILLIKPPIRGFQHEIGRHCPIGLAYLAAALRRDGHDVSLFDGLSFTQDNHVVNSAEYTERDRLKLARHPRWQHLLHWGARLERIAEALSASQADVVGVSCMFSPYYETAFEVVRLARRVLPAAHILVGGQHPTVAPDHVLGQCPEVDVAVLGEAEETIGEVLKKMASHVPLTDQDGVAFRCGQGYCRCIGSLPGRIHRQPRRTWSEDLNALARPASDLIAFDRYEGTATLITSRGCPFSCTFCTVHAMVGKRFRSRTADDVVEEIEHYINVHGVRRFAIEDDNFTFSIPRVEEICHAIIARNLDIELSLPNGMTVVKLSKPLVELMARAGFRDLFLGLESTDNERLLKIAKRFTSLDQVTAGYRWFTEQGVSTAASLIVGLPGQGAREIARDIFNLASRNIRFWSNPFYPIPGSPDYDTCRKQNIVSEDTDFVLFDQFNFAIPTSRFSSSELYRIWVIAQTISHWPAYVLEGQEAASRPTVEQAVRRLVEISQEKRRTVTGAARVECPAEPCEAYWDGQHWSVAVHGDSCFAAVHGVADWSGLPALNQYTADVVATAVSLYTGSLYDAHLVPPRGAAAGTDRVHVALEPIPSDALFTEFHDEFSSLARSATTRIPTPSVSLSIAQVTP